MYTHMSVKYKCSEGFVQNHGSERGVSPIYYSHPPKVPSLFSERVKIRESENKRENLR